MIDVERAVALQKKGWSLRQLRPNSRAISVLSIPFNVSDVVSARHLGISSQTWSRSITRRMPGMSAVRQTLGYITAVTPQRPPQRGSGAEEGLCMSCFKGQDDILCIRRTACEYVEYLLRGTPHPGVCTRGRHTIRSTRVCAFKKTSRASVPRVFHERFKNATAYS